MGREAPLSLVLSAPRSARARFIYARVHGLCLRTSYNEYQVPAPPRATAGAVELPRLCGTFLLPGTL